MDRLQMKFAVGICCLLWLAGSVGYGQPQIVRQPVGAKDVTVGSPITFLVEASSTNEMRYQWRRNGVNIPGANSNVFYIAAVQLTNAGKYSVAVADSSGATNSSIAKLTVAVPLIQGRDNFADAYELGVLGEGELRSNNTNATAQTGEPVHAGQPGGKSIWFKVHPTLAGIMTINTLGSDFDTLVAVYSGSSVDQLSPLALDINNDDTGGFLAGKISFNLPVSLDPFEFYYIAVDGFDGQIGNVALSWEFELTDAVLPVITARPDRRTVAYGSDLDLVVAYAGPGALGNWLLNATDLQRPESVLSLRGIDDSKVGLYSVRIENGRGKKVFTYPANIQVNIQNDGTADTNAFTFDKFPNARDFARSKRLLSSRPSLQSIRPLPTGGGGPAAGYTSTQIFSTINSTKEIGEPNHAGEPGGASEWFSYQPTQNGTLHINTDGSSYDTVLAVYTGPGDSFATLTEVASDNNSGANGLTSRVRFSAVANTVYYIAVDGVGGAKGTVRLNLNFGQPVTITAPVTDQVVPLGTNVTFAVGASGSTALGFRWHFAGIPVAGATNNTLTISNVANENVGQYLVVISNLVNVVSNSATLTVLQAPVITTGPSNQVINSGDTLSLTAAVTGSGPLTYQWFFNGSTLVGTDPTLLIANIRPDQAGNYSVVVSNTAGTATSAPGIISVAYAPIISVQPRSQTAASGASVAVAILATGNPTPTYQWQRNGVNLIDDGNVSGSTSASLRINSFTEANAGTYRAIAQNAVGNTASVSATIQLNSPLRLLSFGMENNGSFTLQLAGEAGKNYEVQVSGDFRTWRSLGTNFATDGISTFSQAVSTNSVGQFYRLRLIP